jgi:hypothetical protein
MHADKLIALHSEGLRLGQYSAYNRSYGSLVKWATSVHPKSKEARRFFLAGLQMGWRICANRMKSAEAREKREMEAKLAAMTPPRTRRVRAYSRPAAPEVVPMFYIPAVAAR